MPLKIDIFLSYFINYITTTYLHVGERERYKLKTLHMKC